MTLKLSHERLAKTHDFGVRLSLGVEVCAALCAAHGQSGQRVLENLLKAKELDDRQVHRGVETQATLVGAERGIELNAEATIDVNAALIIAPRNAEHELAFRLNNSLENRQILVFGLAGNQRSQCRENLEDGLVEFTLVGVARYQFIEDRCELAGKLGCIKLFAHVLIMALLRFIYLFFSNIWTLHCACPDHRRAIPATKAHVFGVLGGNFAFYRCACPAVFAQHIKV